MEEGNKARLNVPVVEGVITDTQYNKQERCLEHLLTWETVEADGIVSHSRWFLESELTEVDDEA